MSASQEDSGHWDAKFASRPWGRYPPEDLVRFMGRNFRDMDRSSVRVLEVGCGPGANLWFLHREGYAVHGIDVSPTAIGLAEQRLARENAGLNPVPADLRVGNFVRLPWPDGSFDVVVDIFALYANRLATIELGLGEIARVLKPAGRLYSKTWGTRTLGFGEGRQVESGTFDEIPRGPCRDMGLTHFFTPSEMERVYGRGFRPDAIDVVFRTDHAAGQHIEELLGQFTRNN